MDIMEFLLTGFFVCAIGACIGSFLNVAALRAVSGESIILPPSKCPLCGALIKWYDNIPVLSYFFTFKGKCRSCGEKVSLQYPIVEALTAAVFLAFYAAFGVTVKTLLLLILACISIVIMITDIKKEYVFDIHSWLLIIFSIITSLYLNGLENFKEPALGVLAGVIAMEGAARLAYYLIKKKKHNEIEKDKNENADDADETAKEAAEGGLNNNQEDDSFDVNEYMSEKKRAFGEGDTYLAAAAGALLGWKYLLLSLFLAVIIQALCVLPAFLSSLYKNKQYELLISLGGFFALAGLYFIVTNIINLHLYIVLAIAALLIFFAVNTINRLKESSIENGFYTVPFGPAILISAFTVFFFGEKIMTFLSEHIFS